MHPDVFRLNARLQETHWWFAARREVLGAIVRAVVPSAPGTVVVDVGCGTGANLAGLCDQYDVVGLDPSPEAVQMAAERFPNARFVCGSTPDDLGEIVHHARLFLLTDVLEHVRDDFELLSRWLAASRPGAVFLLTVPADRSLWSEHDRTHGHFRRYDRRRFVQLWDGLPVTCRMLSAFNFRLYPAVKLVRGVNRLLGRTGGPLGTDLGLPRPWLNALLRRVFAGEARRLLDVLSGTSRPPARRGVSWLAVLRREAGVITPRRRLADVVPDQFDPDREDQHATHRDGCAVL
jgi:SAM-dependent methyltransferase